MAQQLSPWLEGAYGWNFGEGGWNSGMDQNLLKFSFLFDRNVDSIVASLPPAVDGQAHYLTTDNRLYFAVGTTYFSTPVPKWFSVIVRGTGATWQYNGAALVQVDSPIELDTRLDSIEVTVASLGTAAFEDISAFATQAALDVIEGQAQAYTDVLRSDLANSVNPALGAGLSGFDDSLAYPAGTVGADLKVVKAGQFDQIEVGSGVKGLPQTNVGVQIHRDNTATTPSYHGVNVGDYFAGDTNAFNPIGTDIAIGDGTQGVGFLLGHVNDFQSTDITDLGLGGNAQHFVFISQPVLKSGTISRTTHFSAIDQLGVRDTPGFGVAGFEVNGPAVGNNQTGISTVIRHGTNAKSMHIQAGSTDAGADLTSGGAICDFEAPILIRQATASTSKATGALTLNAGGIGCSGSIFAGTEVSAGAASPQLALRDASNVLRGRTLHDGTTMTVQADTGTSLKLQANGGAVELLVDRFRPVVDNTLNCGDASHRWVQLFAATATIGTSDENTKTEILPIDDKLLDAWADVSPVVFRFKDALASKGDDARIHAGYIAQQVRDTLAAKGIDGFRYALLCEDELTEEVTEWRTVKVPRIEIVQVERESFDVIDGVLTRTVSVVDEERHVTTQMQVFNGDGSPYLVNGNPLVQSVTILDELQEPYTVVVKTGEKRMGLRYEHCLVIECAYLRREILKAS